MSEKKKTAFLWGGALLLILGGVTYFSIVPPPNAILRVGVVTPLTGENLEYGLVTQKAYNLAVTHVNQSGGKQVELVYEDGKCDGAEEAAAAQRIIDAGGVGVILGGTCSGNISAVSEVTHEADVLLLLSSLGNEGTENGELVYSMFPDDLFAAKTISGHVLEMGYDRVAIITEDTDSARGMSSVFRGAFDGQVVFDETFSSDESNFWTLVSNLRNLNSDAVYLVVENPEAGELILQQMNNLAVNTEVYASNALLDQFDVSQKRGLYSGLIFAELQLPSDGRSSEMLAAYEQEYGNAPEALLLTAAAYDSVFLIAEAVGNGSQGANNIAAYLDNNISDWDGTLGTLNFDENGSAEIDLALIQVVDGELMVINAQEEIAEAIVE
ncbi:MAG: ABC transporter substrate-binding protein [Parcubacteria group bacterium]|nr:ABC transporter substrate-binding protein [Parcubacteria group bacterium]